MIQWGTRLGLVAALAAGCNGPDPGARTRPAPAANANPVVGPPAAAAARPQLSEQKGDDEGHAHEAPHGGSLIELGDEFAHLELLLDTATGRLTAYALDGEAERPVRLAQSSIVMTLTLPDAPSPIGVTLAPVESALTGEKAGDTSQFAAVVAELKDRKAFRGTVAALAIRGQSFSRVEFSFPAPEP
jgi:hypothetical protein